MSLETVAFKPMALYGVEDSRVPLIINGVESPNGVAGAAALHTMFREQLAGDYDAVHPLYGLYWKHQADRYFLGTYTGPGYLEARLGTEVQTAVVPSGRYARDGIRNWQEFLETKGPERFGRFVTDIAQSLETEVENCGMHRDKSRPEIEIYHNRALGDLTLLFPIKA